MASHNRCDTATEHSHPDGAGLAVVRRSNGRTLRKSCDRCHQQKLQCVGNKASLTRCKRCQRAGLECVYSARSSRKTSQSYNDPSSWDNWDTSGAWTTWDDAAGDLETIFGLESRQLDDILPISPLSHTSTNNCATFLDPGLPSTEHTPGTTIDQGLRASIGHQSAPCLDVVNMPLQPSTNLCDDSHGSSNHSYDPLAELASAFKNLELTFARAVESHAGRDSQDYPVGDVLSAMEDFSRVLKMNDAYGKSALGSSQTIPGHLRSKKASLAAQSYVLCVRLMASLSEQMLYSLLASPLPPASSTAGKKDGLGEGSSSPSTHEGYLSKITCIPPGMRIRDLHAPAQHFRHVLEVSLNLLRAGSSHLDDMEYALGLEQTDSTVQGSVKRVASRPSLPARFVASIWEDEAITNSNSPKVFLERCRIAINGLADY